MDLIDVRAALTVVMLVLFAGIVVWAYSSKRKKQFDAAAHSVLEDDGTPETEQRHRGR
jgi:cytochrome c oxidase cbb3-type subunit 4